MNNKVKAIIAQSKGLPVVTEEILVPDPGPGEALVKIQACGVCHTDLHYREGAINDEFPFLLGHEASGLIEKIGPEVDDLSVGDFVIIAWRALHQCQNPPQWLGKYRLCSLSMPFVIA